MENIFITFLISKRKTLNFPFSYTDCLLSLFPITFEYKSIGRSVKEFENLENQFYVKSLLTSDAPFKSYWLRSEPEQFSKITLF